MLERINSPSDLKSLSLAELESLAQEIRQLIVQTVARTGGHLSSNLGVVELTLALHYLFDSPRDKIVWDVGHQCYTHKLVTGRRDEFDTLRQPGGISGFPRTRESEHDQFDTGHGSTAISVALALATARDLKNESGQVVAVVGDGSMTGGMSWEALNCAGHRKTGLIVCLNDNEMSIARNVGALPSYLSRLRADPHYQRAKESFEQATSLLPLGGTMLETVHRFKLGLKQLLVPGMVFEEMGLTYLGPVDGHHLGQLTEALRQAASLPGPKLIHVITRKGRGYPPAETEPSRFHSTGPFDPETGRPARTDSDTFTSAFGRALIQLAEADRRIVAITAAMPDGTGLRSFAERFPERFFDVGMAEQHAVTFAAGLAAGGLKPVVAIYSTFLQRAYDQVLHDVCLQGLPVVFCLDRAGLVAEDGPTHHGAFDLCYLRQLPKMAVMAPSTLPELASMLRTALDADQPVALRYPKGTGPNPPVRAPRLLPWGRGELLREGDQVALVAIGPMVEMALEAAELLAGRGVSAAVANARFVKPLDHELILGLAKRTGALVTVEEGALCGGFGGAVGELLCQEGLTGVAVHSLGLPDSFCDHGSRQQLRADCRLSAEGIAQAAAELVGSAVAAGR